VFLFCWFLKQVFGPLVGKLVLCAVQMSAAC
jgi:hypothetical protein